MKEKTQKKTSFSLTILTYVGSFAENKDIAAELREKHILPALRQGREVVLDYEGVDTTTQSFTHALISEAIREFGIGILDRISFKNCNEDIKRIISIVVEYMQGDMNSPIP